MKQILWNADKNAVLYKDRGVCFEDVLLALEKGALLDRLEHPNQRKYPGQKIMIVEIEKYAYLVPYIETEEFMILKTIIPSRKATKKYLVAEGDTDETNE